MALNKTPGVDGLPVEFYLQNWEIISDDLLDLYNTILNTGCLSETQRKGIIILIPKSDGEVLSIDEFRPISLLCVDYKILSKILSERIKLVLHKVVYNKQFCGIPGRSIVQCNMELRDIIHYANDSNSNLAVLNLDWYKAFDLVPIEFIFKVLEALGFGETFVNWIKTLYNGIESSIEINNILTDFFPVQRSVRQGCPLSMSLFLLFQEPFYRAVIASRVIRPMPLPDSSEIKILGYADDTNILITSNESIIEVFSLISRFEEATGSKLNRNKTKIFGIGTWKNRDQWPLQDFKIEKDHLYTLGIYHSNNYNNCVDKNWSEIISKLKNHCNMLLSRRLTLHQRVTYANAVMLSKMWYIAHIYPLTEKYAKEANTIVFRYIWGGRYEPIKRNTVFRPKNEGGLAVVNCLVKAKTIMLSTFIKCYVHND